jgi:hypothetical protein
MTTDGLRELRRILTEADSERRDIGNELTSAKRENDLAGQRFHSWNSGFLFKHIWKRAFAERQMIAEESAAKLAELEEQWAYNSSNANRRDHEQANLTTSPRRLHGMAGCQKIWDTTAESDESHFERTIASRMDNFGLKKKT